MTTEHGIALSSYVDLIEYVAFIVIYVLLNYTIHDEFYVTTGCQFVILNFVRVPMVVCISRAMMYYFLIDANCFCSESPLFV